MPQPPRPLPATYQQAHRDPSRRSPSMASVPGSIPMSALISPHAPSIPGSSVFHMRDPRKPPPIQSTPWSLSLPSSGGGGSWLERGGSPLHAWLFFVGFVIFPIWWVAAFVGIPRTRRLGGNELEKGVVLDDPQLEFGECFLLVRAVGGRVFIYLTSRCKLVAQALSNHGRCLTFHLYPFRCSRCNFRPVKSCSGLHVISTLHALPS
jgi:hypothetical protein